MVEMGFTQYVIQEVQVLNVEAPLMVRKSGLAISLMEGRFISRFLQRVFKNIPGGFLEFSRQQYQHT